MKMNKTYSKLYRYFSLFAVLLMALFSINSSCEDSEGDYSWQTCGDNSTDKYFDTGHQWHLINDQYPELDLDVLNVWNEGNRGDDLVVAVVDDGLDYSHEDLACNTLHDLNYNYLTGESVLNKGYHGTAVAGIIAARDKNGHGVRGIAPRAKIVAYNMLEYSYISNMYDSMIRNKSLVSVSSNSWGITDNTGRLYPSSHLWEQGVYEGITTGRDGKGIVYAKAAGNGGINELDNSNYDGKNNFYGIITVAGVGPAGTRASYSERGPNVWISGFTADYDRNNRMVGITTTDTTGPSKLAYSSSLGDNLYVNSFNGTSAATPMVSGVALLMLKANPDLTWRDVKVIMAKTAFKVDPSDSEWSTNGAGYDINYKYGFGVANAEAAVNMAKTWSNLPAFTDHSSSTDSADMAIPDNNTSGISRTINVNANISKIEHVDINVSITHHYSGDLEITLISPSGTESILSEKRTCPDGCSYFYSGSSFKFGSVRLLGEDPDGTWTLVVKDLKSGNTGTLNSWNLKIYGEAE